MLPLTAACAGPSTPINASLKSFPQNVRIGAAIVPPDAIAPIPPSAPRLSGGPITLPVPVAAPTGAVLPSVAPAAPPVACPKAGLSETPLLAAGADISAAPPVSAYSYRTRGKHTVGGSQASTVDYPETATRVVGKARADTGPTGALKSFSYDVGAVLGTNRTVTTYQVIPLSSTPADPATSGAAGLYISAIKTVDSKGAVTASFVPQPPMLVLPFPADQGVSFNVSSVDPMNGTTITYSGVVGAHVVVDACGKVIDTRAVTHTGTISVGGCGSAACPDGRSSSGEPTSFTGVYDIATQYGGLSVQDKVHVDGVSPVAPFTDDLSGVISRVPLAPAA
jgi:hypothetical protein